MRLKISANRNQKKKKKKKKKKKRRRKNKHQKTQIHSTNLFVSFVPMFILHFAFCSDHISFIPHSVLPLHAGHQRIALEEHIYDIFTE